MNNNEKNFQIDTYIIQIPGIDIDVLVITGVIEGPNAKMLWEEVDRKLDIRKKCPLILDITEVSFIAGGASMGGIMRLYKYKRQNNDYFSIVCNRNDKVYDDFNTFGFSELLNLVKTVRQTIEKIKAHKSRD